VRVDQKSIGTGHDPVDLATRLEQTGKQLQEGLSQDAAQPGSGSGCRPKPTTYIDKGIFHE